MKRQGIQPEYEYKALTSEISDVDVKNGIVTGYYAAFNNIDNGRDMIVPGAFTKTIAERGPNGKKQILHLLNHWSSDVLGKPSVLKEDLKGLYFETKIVSTTLGVDTLKLYEAGVYNEHSIGYRTIKYEVVNAGTDDEYYKLIELKLWEGSTVPWGMNDETPFTGFKGLNNPAELDKKRTALLKALKVEGLTDDTFSQLEIALVQLTDAYKQISKSLDSNEAAAGTLGKSQPTNTSLIKGLQDLNNLIKQ